MHSGPIQHVVLVHGYSVRTLNSWGRLPALLQADGYDPGTMFLSAFVSLDDYVSCDDLALAMERRVADLETNQGIDLGKTAFIMHSTGAIVARRWLLNRFAAGKKMPSHLISCAGANHGSTLAQLGRTELAYVFRQLTEGSDVGKRVLEDLDFGSEFLRTLNADWLEAWNDGSPLFEETYCFSMGGTDHSYWQNQLTWAASELGSDGTVRISAANLNFRIIRLAPPYGFNATNIQTLRQAAPHLVVETPQKKYSHTTQTEPDTQGLVISKAVGAAQQILHFGRPAEQVSAGTYGILDGIQSPDERPYKALKEAFDVQNPPAYAALATAWGNETAAWTTANPDQANSTIVVAIHDALGKPVDNSVVLILDPDGTIKNVSGSLLGHQPIRNQASPSILSVYVNTAKFEAVHPHRIHLEAQTETPYVSDNLLLDADLSSDTDTTLHVIAPNEVTYVDVRVARDPTNAFVFYKFNDPKMAAIANTAYPPFPGSPL